MGYPDKSMPGHETEAHSKPVTSLDRLKAMAGFMRNKSAGAAPLLLTERDTAKQPASTHTGPSVLSASVEMTGSLNSPGALHIYGAVNGNVHAVDLTIFANGSLKGDVVAETVLVHGAFEGRIHANRIQLCPGAVVRGDLVYASLDVDGASLFEGVSKRSDNPAAEADGGDVRRLTGRARSATA
jgi:cytoskeletal protein CcmA (bactofilin family)